MVTHAPDPDGGRPEEGLHGPRGTVLGSMEPPRRRSRLRLTLQLVGFVVGLGLLGWVLSIALAEGNRPAVESLLGAPAHLLGALIGLSGLAIVLNGVVFRIVLSPLRRLALIDIIAVNAISTFLSILPFKISVLVRVLIHHRRDGVPLRDLVSWFAAVSACGLAILVPLVAVSLWRQQVDALWLAGAIGGTAVATACAVPCGLLAGSRMPLLHRLSLGADRIVRHPRVVAAQYVARVADLSTVFLRFHVAALIIGLELPLDRAVLLGSTYFLIAVVSPASAVGFTEIGTVGVGALSGLDTGEVAIVALTVTLANVGTALVLAVPSFVYLRPDRIIGGRRVSE